MSKFKKLLIPAIILVVLVAAYLVVQNLPEKEEEGFDFTPSEVIQIFNFVKADLEQIKIDKHDDTMWFRYTTIQVEEDEHQADGTVKKRLVDRNVWQAVEPEGMRVSTSDVDSIAWNANTLRAQRLIEEEPSDLSVYGLQDPVQLTFIMKDGTQHVLQVGNTTPTGGAYYAKKADEPAVYTIGSYEVGRFLQSKFDLMDTELFDTEYTVEDFTNISFTRRGRKVFDVKREERSWLLTHPIEAEAHFENVSGIAFSLGGIYASSYVDQNVDDLQKYGLHNPAYVFEFTTAGNTYKLSLGNREPDSGSYYAMLNDENLIFTIIEGYFHFLDKPIEEIVNTFVHLQNILEVSEMVISFDGHSDVIRINEDREDFRESWYEFNGTMLYGREDDDDDYVSAFKKYYQGAIGLVVNKIDLDAQPVLRNPEVTIKYVLRDGQTIVVEFVSTPDNIHFYAFKNGEYTGITLRKAQLDDQYYNGIRYSRQKLVDMLAERSK